MSNVVYDKVNDGYMLTSCSVRVQNFHQQLARKSAQLVVIVRETDVLEYLAIRGLKPTNLARRERPR